MMKCIYCGEELQEGSLYCPKCGKAVQIVPDYNIYEEDYLKQVLTEENQKVSDPNPKKNKNPKSSNTKKKSAAHNKNQKKKQQQILLIVAGIVCVLVFSLLILGAAVRSNHANSFSYQVKQAEKALQAGDEAKAISYYENALELDNSSIDVRLSLAELYVKQKEYDSALVLYQEVFRKDKTNRKACKGMIAIYEAKKDTDAILSLEASVDESLLDLFAAYQVEQPGFSLKSGIFDSAQVLQMLSTKRYEIYYTIDGTDPKTRGTLYTQPIQLNENNKTYVVKAVCKNEDGIYSDVMQATYQISIPAPNIPVVTPDGGTFDTETTITITVPSGCSAYYTWNGNTPSSSSTKYNGPISVPEGNNILSVILIDHSTGLHSDVYKGNFVYYSQNYDDITDSDIEEGPVETE